MEIVQTMNSDPGLAVGEALPFVLAGKLLLSNCLLLVQLYKYLRLHPPPGAILPAVAKASA